MSAAAAPSPTTPPPFPPNVYRLTTTAAVAYGENSLSNIKDFLKQVPEGPVLILTGNSLSKSPLLDKVKAALGDRLGGVYKDIGQHAPLEGIHKGVEEVEKVGAKSLVGFGGGSVIDAGKAISHFYHEKHQAYLPQIALPTTLSAAEGTINAGFTKEGSKKGVRGENLVPKFIIYDPELSTSTPERLWLSTGLRALDHAVEALYRPSATPLSRSIALTALRDLFVYLPISKANPENLSARSMLQQAAWLSLGNEVVPTAMGISHALGHRLGATYAIPHGITSCITLAPTIALLWNSPGVLTSRDRYDLFLAASGLPEHYKTTSVTPENAGTVLSAAVKKLVIDLGLESGTNEYKVPEKDLEKIATGAVEELVGWNEERKPPIKDAIRMLKEECA